MSKQPCWDEERTISRLGGDRSLIEKLVTLFLRDAPGQLHQALNGIQRQDYDESHVAVHSLKGTSSNFCTVRFEGICTELLKALKLQDWQEAASIHAELTKAYYQLEVEFELFLSL